jgi:hypothetical protein
MASASTSTDYGPWAHFAGSRFGGRPLVTATNSSYHHLHTSRSSAPSHKSDSYTSKRKTRIAELSNERSHLDSIDPIIMNASYTPPLRIAPLSLTTSLLPKSKSRPRPLLFQPPQPKFSWDESMRDAIHTKWLRRPRENMYLPDSRYTFEPPIARAPIPIVVDDGTLTSSGQMSPPTPPPPVIETPPKRAPRGRGGRKPKGRRKTAAAAEVEVVVTVEGEGGATPTPSGTPLKLSPPPSTNKRKRATVAQAPSAPDSSTERGDETNYNPKRRKNAKDVEPSSRVTRTAASTYTKIQVTAPSPSPASSPAPPPSPPLPPNTAERGRPSRLKFPTERVMVSSASPSPSPSRRGRGANGSRRGTPLRIAASVAEKIMEGVEMGMPGLGVTA